MSSPSAQHLNALVGSTVGNSYALDRVLGQGRHGALIEARNVRLGQRCIVRMLRADAARKTALLTALGQHSALAHPHLSPPRDVMTLPDDQLLLASPILTGQDLNQRVAAGGKLSASEGVLMMRQIASALHALHQKGLFHGNLTASNVFFTKYDDVAVDNALGDSKGSSIVQLIDAGLSILDGQAQTAADDQRNLGRLVQAFVFDLSSEQRKILERTQDARPEARFASVLELWRAFEGAGQSRKVGTRPEKSGSIATTMVPQIRMTPKSLRMKRYGLIAAAAIAAVIVGAMVLSVLLRKSPSVATQTPIVAPSAAPEKVAPPPEPEKPAVAAAPSDDSADASGDKAAKGKKKKGAKKAKKH